VGDPLLVGGLGPGTPRVPPKSGPAVSASFTSWPGPQLTLVAYAEEECDMVFRCLLTSDCYKRPLLSNTVSVAFCICPSVCPSPVSSIAAVV